MKITAISLELGKTRLFISPMSPKTTEKREKREREREREKKRLLAVFNFYNVDFRDLNDRKSRQRKLTDASLGDLVFKNLGRYINNEIRNKVLEL